MAKQKHSVAEDCGRYYEVGFNIGILTYLRQHRQRFRHHLDDLYLDDIRQLHFPEMVKNSFKRHKFTIDQQKRKIATQWFLFFLQKGYLAGLTFFHEYVQSLRWKEEDGPIEIAYYQCSFCGENSIYTLAKTDEQEQQAMLNQLKHYQIDPHTIHLYQHREKGRFLKADTLMLLRLDDAWRLLCVDLSIFSISSDENLRDPNDAQILRELLMRDLSYMRAKSVFANLSIDTAKGAPGFIFSQGLDTYFTAFKHGDKESAKLIQAGSYAHDLYTVLREQGLFSATTAVTFNIIGYTDRGVNAMTCTQENLDILATCAHIYRSDTSLATIQQAREEVLETIRANASSSFQDGDQFTGSIMSLVNNHADGVHWVEPVYQEEIDDFVNLSDPVPFDRVSDEVKALLAGSDTPLSELTLRNAHRALVLRELEETSKKTYIFLTGNPGIGKTTAVANFLSQHREEGFLLLYISPRKHVNIDIINKFRDPGTKKLEGDTFALTSDALIIQANQGDPAVHYYAAHREGNMRRQGLKKLVTFIDAQNLPPGQTARYLPRLSRLSAERIWDHGETISGVLNSVCNALYISLRDDLSRQLIATVAMQSLKKVGHGADARDTLDHLKKIFHTATKNGRVLPSEMRKISGKIKHLFIMIDEVTGDESGVAFLDGIRKFVNEYQLTQHGFNTKVIVADASIVDHDVIQQHIQEGTSEYEPDKVYFRNVTSPGPASPLSRFEFPFYKKPAVAINANSYPARSLSITYHICMEFLKFDEATMLHAKDRLTKQIQQRMVEDIDTLLQRADVPQIIVYIQDKKRLTQLIQDLQARRGSFEQNSDYITIHASISDKEKREINDYKEQVRVVFMTTSASRGLSFPKTTHILVDIPRFEVEQNLMEIIQVIYRGRGDAEIEQREKALLLYISERAIYYDDGMREMTLRESALNVLNVLLILKTAIMTRIVGYGQVGQRKLMIIPIGGKSVLAAGESYIGILERLITELRREYMRHYDRPWLKEVYRSWRELLGQADFHLSTPREDRQQTPQRQQTTYLSLLSTLTTRFTDAVYNGLHHLLDWEPVETGYIAGALLIVPAEHKQLQERYLLQLREKLQQAKGSELYRRMQYIAHSDEYPPSLVSAMGKAIELLDKLNQASPEITQLFTQDSRHADQYYTLPLLAFMQDDVLKQHFSDTSEEPEANSFRWLLTMYARTLYPITLVLPIGDDYDEFPFILFRSFNLREIRNRIFSDTHLLISNEMNVLNMLLSYRNERKRAGD